MAVLSKRYLRYLTYFFAFVILRYAILELYSSRSGRVDVIDGDPTLQLTRSVWLSANGLEEKDLNHQVVVNIGKKKCFHVGRLWKHCFANRNCLDGHIAYTERKVVSKDLKGSFGFNWFGVSEFLYYDVLSFSSISIMDESEVSKVGMVSSVTHHEGDSTKSLDDLHVTVIPFSINDLKRGVPVFCDINVFFGEDCVDPRPSWTLEKQWTLDTNRFPSFLSYKLLNLSELKKQNTTLKLRDNGKFKIVQLADLHFATGKNKCRDEYPKHENCEADPKTAKFIGQVLDIESPDLVVYTGDQVMGDLSTKDSETSLLKALAPVIERKIAWALVWGNHDDEGSLNRWELSEFASDLPYSLFQIGPKDTKDNSFGVGNYFHQVFDPTDREPLITLYFLDSHKYSKTGKIYPGYDWIKEAQWEYLQKVYDEKLGDLISKRNGKHSTMAFFHIPLPEYLNLESKKIPDAKNPLIGSFKEGVTAPKYNSGGMKALEHLNVDVASCGHDHCNDYCLLDDSTAKRTWLCYGGGGGEGGYAGYGGTERRIRTYEIDTNKGNIYTWKRLNGSPTELFDYQLMVSDGIPNVE